MKKFIILTAMLLSLTAHAWEPTKPITVLIGNQPGSGNELVFRAVSASIAKTHPKADFIVTLKPGAEGVIALNQLYSAEPDGHTIAIPSYMGTFVTNDVWQKDLKKFQYNSFTNVLGMGQSPLTIIANSTSKINTIAELSNFVKNTTKPVNFAIGGSAHRMAYELFMSKADGNKDLVKTIPFNGPVQAAVSVASDSGTEFGIMPIATALPLLKAGKVKVLGITGSKKLTNLPDAKPIKVGGSYINVFASWALILPPNTPKEIVKWYQDAFIPALLSEEIKQYYEANLINLEEKELTQEGFSKEIEELRSVFIPIAMKTDLNK
ncbi:hypothetical protein EB001_03015 [bacterium]|nr:hypothetical protein [bacterium]